MCRARQRGVDSACNADRLAIVKRLDLGQLLGVLEAQVADPPDQPATPGRAQPAPVGILKRIARGADREVDVLGVARSIGGLRLEDDPGRDAAGLDVGDRLVDLV